MCEEGVVWFKGASSGFKGVVWLKGASSGLKVVR